MNTLLVGRRRSWTALWWNWARQPPAEFNSSAMVIKYHDHLPCLLTYRDKFTLFTEGFIWQFQEMSLLIIFLSINKYTSYFLFSCIYSTSVYWWLSPCKVLCSSPCDTVTGYPFILPSQTFAGYLPCARNNTTCSKLKYMCKDATKELRV